jgi:hypothetical protein
LPSIGQTVEKIYTLSQSDKDTMLGYHNILRQKNYGMTGAMTWNDTLMNSAATYGSACKWAHSCTNTYGCGYGENLAAAAGSGTFPIKTWKAQMDDWKNEEKNWNCGTNACATGQVCGHFTQLVWKSSTSVGCGIINCPTNTIFPGTTFPVQQYMICQYYPAGNYQGQNPLVAPSVSGATCPAIPTPDVVPTSTPVSPVTPVTAPVAPPTGTPQTPPPAPVMPVAPPRSPNPPPTTPVSVSPGSPKWAQCIGDYWPTDSTGKQYSSPTPCQSAPTTMLSTSGVKGLYCAVGDPKGYYWPVKNKDTTACPYSVGALVQDTTSTKDQILPMEAWIGIAVGIAVFIIIIIVVVIVVVKSKKDERV